MYYYYLSAGKGMLKGEEFSSDKKIIKYFLYSFKGVNTQNLNSFHRFKGVKTLATLRRV